MFRSLSLAVALCALTGSSAFAAAPKEKAKDSASEAPKKVIAKNCGSNLHCMSLAAKTCEQARANHDVIFRMGGASSRVPMRYEILGKEGERCLLKSGQQTPGPQKKNGAGSMICRVEPAKLSELFMRWKRGQMSSSDLTNCERQ